MNQAHLILQKSRYMILLICMWNWAFMEERKRNNRFISIIVFS